LFVGPIVKENTIEPTLLDYFYKCDDIIKTGKVNDVEKYMSCMDIFILPSYREGFGMSVVEAQAMEVAVITTEYLGPSSAMKKGETGLEIPIRNVESIIDSIVYLIENKEKTNEFGKNSRKWVESTFDQKKFKVEYIKNRKALLGLD
jgi:glycosyltransferase involved in cell wall biosynthesis